MALTRSKKAAAAASIPSWSLSSLLSLAKSLVFDPSYSVYAACALILVEAVVNPLIIHKVRYTEIDWIAYMQEVEGVIGKNGTYDYAELRGDTGPLVYPAGFVWIYSFLYRLTDSGTDVRTAQYAFALLYLLTLAAVFRLMIRSGKLPPYALVFMSVASYRVHSIFVLRLFNDPVAMFLLYVALNCYVSDRWSLGSTFFSLAVSVKMNILLFAPALFLAFLATQGVVGT
jgi:alpha-1,3-mannosyltransferase